MLDARADLRRPYVASGEMHAEYDSIVRSIVPGDVIEFSNQAKFTVTGSLGAGGTTHILLVRDATDSEYVLRIPLQKLAVGRAGNVIGEMADYIDSFHNGHGVYAKSALIEHLVQMYPGMSYPPEYLLVEPLRIEFTLEDVLKAGSTISPEKRRLVTGAPLEAVAKHSWQFDQIGDLRPANLAWVGDGWKVIDMTDDFFLYAGGYLKDRATGARELPHTFQLKVYDALGKPANDPTFPYEPLQRRLNETIDQERLAHGWRNPLSKSSPEIVEAVRNSTLRDEKRRRWLNQCRISVLRDVVAGQ